MGAGYSNDLPACVPPARRVHITSVTLEHLNGAYKVEDGDGQERDPYLKLHGVITHLVVNPKVLQVPSTSYNKDS